MVPILPPGSTPLLLQGRYRDSQRGLYYLQSRYDDPPPASSSAVIPAAPLSPYAYAVNAPSASATPATVAPQPGGHLLGAQHLLRLPSAHP